ncbi:ketopantoate reductase family protein [Glaciecola sp. 33A]|uniref:ketopantoate reductase family protein n=1 Tax=Glaciecola sp. 33A TaxID=2057807 RepID=UPI000C33F598|nr:2-dehydropantoate 2-reductase [Glaciecola sp. 33A]PKH99843.1 2-dehydropantoate 2-reductase [Glaciecola sp. 33A]
MADIQNIKNIGIVGRGAIGVNIALYLQSADNIKTTLLIRDHYNRSDRLSLSTPDAKIHTIKCKQAHISESSLKQLDMIILPVKQYQIEGLLQEIAEKLDPKTTILLLHNGMGGIELVQMYLPNNPLLVATTTDGVYKTSPTCFVQTASGQLDIGVIYNKRTKQESNYKESTDEKSTDEKSTDEKNMLENHDVPKWDYVNCLHPHLVWHTDIVVSLYQKLAVNAAINPLTALKNCKNGELVNYSKDVSRIKEEIFDLFEFMNLALDNHALSLHIDAVIQLTKENYSSMHQDFQNGRETEVEGILGFLLAKGQETGMKMAYVQQLYEQIKQHPYNNKKA